MPILHVVMPVFNEGPTLEQCVQRVVQAPLPRGWALELVVIDDHSADSQHDVTVRLMQRLQHHGVAVKLLRHAVNRGKGAALQTGFDALLADKAHDDDAVVIQDADLEYDPADYAVLLEPLIDGEARVVVGTRWGPHTPLPTLGRRLHAMGNRTLTTLSNVTTGYRLTDMECCYKLMTVGVLREVLGHLTEQRFGIEPQIIAALARLREPIAERPVRYDPRSTDEGKKINWRDGVRALVVIVRERFRRV